MESRNRKILTVFRYVSRLVFGHYLASAGLIMAFIVLTGVLGRLWDAPTKALLASTEAVAHRFHDYSAKIETGAQLSAAMAGGAFDRKAYSGDPDAYLGGFFLKRKGDLRFLADVPFVRSVWLVISVDPRARLASLAVRPGGRSETAAIGSFALRPGIRESGEPEWVYESGLFPGESEASARLVYYAPLHDATGTVGAICVACDSGWISEAIEGLAVSGKECFALTDRDGLMFSRTKGALSDLDLSRLSIMANPDSDGAAERPGSVPVRALDGRRFYAARADLGNGWRIVGVSSYWEIRRPFLVNLLGFLGVLAITFFLAFLSSSLIGRFVSRPLNRLSSDALLAFSGDLEILPVERGPLEVRLLANTLNQAFADSSEKTGQQKFLMESNARIDLLSIDLDREKISSFNGFRLFGVEGSPAEMDFREWMERFHIVPLEKNFNPLLSPSYQERSGREQSPGDMLRDLLGMKNGSTSQREYSFDTLNGEEGYMRVNLVRASRGIVMAACVDLTEEYRTRRELFVLSTRLSYALNATQSVAIFDVSFDTMELWASESFFPMFEIEMPSAGILILPDFEKRLVEGQPPLLDPSLGFGPSDFWKKGSRVFKLNLPRSGASRWVEVRTAETVRGIIGTVIDITREVLEKQAAQEKAETAQELSRVILAALTEVVLGVGREGHCVFMNPAAELLLGFSQAELVGQDLRPIFSPVDSSGRPLPGIPGPLERALRDHAPASSEHERFRRKDGSLYHASIRVQPLLKGGEFIGAVATLVDVSGLVELSDRFAAILGNAVDQIYIVDREFKITMVSDSILKALGGIAASAILGKTVREFLPPGLGEEFRECEKRVLETGQPVRDLILNVPYADGPHWLNIAIIPMRDARGEMDGEFGIARDVTEAYRLDEELRAAKIEAERANQAKSVFLAGMSHEIRTPLNAILGYSQLMAGNSDLGRDQRRMVDTIMRSGEHLLELINSILEISKIEAGRLSILQAGADLYRLLEDIESMFRIRTEAKGLVFHVHRDEGVPRWILIDVQKLRQILINLLGNAVKFTQKGGLSLSVAARGGKLVFEVRDTGPGISDDEKSRLFEPFMQGNAGVNSQGGTGLGLAISREYAKLLGGGLEVEDAAPGGGGSGSLFRCEVALLEVNPGQGGGSNAVRTISGFADHASSPLVLNVDDSESNRLLVRDILAPIGFRVLDANNGREAIRLAEEKAPDVVLMDIIMPDMDGIEAIRRIRSGGKRGDVPIIAVTASAFEEDRRKVLAAGANDFARKPINREDLLEKIGRAIRVEYRYTESADFMEEGKPEAIDLGTVPEELRHELRKAAVELAPFQAEEVIKAIGRIDSTIAAILSRMIERFDFQAIIALLDEREKKDG